MSRQFLAFSALLLATACAALAQSASSDSIPSSPPQQSATPAPPANPAQPGAPKKPKKVWTENELGNLKGPVSVVGGAPHGAAAGGSSSASDTREAEAYRKRLAPLRTQLDDVDRQIQEVKKYGADAGRYNNMSQDALEAKKASLQKKIDDIEDEARKHGIEPGQLR